MTEPPAADPLSADPSPAGPLPTSVTYSPLPARLRADLDARRRWLADMVGPVGPGFGTDAEELVEAIADVLGGDSRAGCLRSEDSWQWLSLGVALGDVLCLDIPGAEWILISDEYGTDPVVRLMPGSEMVAGALTMLAKRVQRGQIVDAETVAALRVAVSQAVVTASPARSERPGARMP